MIEHGKPTKPNNSPAVKATLGLATARPRITDTAASGQPHFLRSDHHHAGHGVPCDCMEHMPYYPTSGPGHTAFGEAGPPESRSSQFVLLFLEIAFLVLAIGLLVLRKVPGWHDFVGDLALSFVAIMVEATPFMLVGSLVGGLIETFVPQEFVSRTLAGRSRIAVFIAAAVGIIFPVCECAIVPVVKRLLNKGVPLSAAIAFLLGGPIVNPIVAGSTWLAYRGSWGVVSTRMICGYVIAVTVALVLDLLFRNKQVLLEGVQHQHTATCGCCGHDHDHEHGGEATIVAKFFGALQHACSDFFQVGRYLVIGAFVAALARTTIGVDACRELFAAPWAAILMMMGLAVALNLCSETDAFIAAGFRGVLPETAQMAFMVLGPMLDMKLVLMYLTVFRKRVIVTLALVTALTVLAAMLLLQYSFGGIPGAQ